MKKFKVGIQLYSIRDDMEKDMDAALGAVKEMGYDYVEFAGYFGKSAEEVKAILDKYDLTAISVHQGIDLFEKEGKAAVDYLNAIGVKYCALPSFPLEEFTNNWTNSMQRIKAVSKLLSDGGIQLMYHNHSFEFQKTDGEFILDKLYNEIPNDMLKPQLDTCWVHYAGENPTEYVKKYNGKIEVLHLKDFVCEKLGYGPVYSLTDENGNKIRAIDKKDNGFKLMPLGSGVQNFREILEAAESAGVEYLIVEQDFSEDRPPMEDAKMSRDYLKSLGI